MGLTSLLRYSAFDLRLNCQGFSGLPCYAQHRGEFRDGLLKKFDMAMVNEVLCKILCHNLVVLIHETRELGIDPMFWSKAA